MKILCVVGARPNFMKVAPILRELRRRGAPWQHRLVHTGQHYDANMSKIFFDQLGLPRPDEDLGVGSASHAVQTAKVMIAFEPCLEAWRPDWVVVVGDVNSTLAATLVASKRGIRVAHVEAGLRSFDRGMPEELNRLLTDQLADLLLTPSPEAAVNLRAEGIPDERIAFVGNVMIDTLVDQLPAIEASEIHHRLGLEAGGYLLATLHRPSNVDDPAVLRELLAALGELARERPVIFPVHPRTRAKIEALGGAPNPGLRLLEPLGYVDFVALTQRAALVVTDSGGLQEETTWLGVPCLTARPNTERPVTLTEGTNRLIPSRRDAVLEAARGILAAPPQGRRPQLWDGHAARRIVDALEAYCENSEAPDGPEARRAP
ncbi:MAG: UDP-N-acetylglucosamine 2-epimerase (non-hydrolyzing) [Acidobacteriota bacterium]